MSRVFALAMIMMLVPFNAMAEQRGTSFNNNYNHSLNLAYELSSVLEQISSDASYEAEHATRHRHYAEAKAYSDLAHSASTLENKVYNSVIVPLRQGVADNVVKAYLQRLESSFMLFQRDGEEVSYYSYYLADAVYEALYLKADLLQELSANDRGRPGRPGRPVR